MKLLSIRNKSKEVDNFKVKANNSGNQIHTNTAFMNKIKIIIMQSAININLLEMSMAKGKTDGSLSQQQKT